MRATGIFACLFLIVGFGERIESRGDGGRGPKILEGFAKALEDMAGCPAVEIPELDDPIKDYTNRDVLQSLASVLKSGCNLPDDEDNDEDPDENEVERRGMKNKGMKGKRKNGLKLLGKALDKIASECPAGLPLDENIDSYTNRMLLQSLSYILWNDCHDNGGSDVTDEPGPATGVPGTYEPPMPTGEPATGGPPLPTGEPATGGPPLPTDEPATGGPPLPTSEPATGGPSLPTGVPGTDEPATDPPSPPPPARSLDEMIARELSDFLKRRVNKQ